MRATGVRGVLIYCRDYRDYGSTLRCSHRHQCGQFRIVDVSGNGSIPDSFNGFVDYEQGGVF
jgi:hypothetical protein